MAELTEYKCYAPVILRDLGEPSLKELQRLGIVTEDKNEVHCKTCLEWIHS